MIRRSPPLMLMATVILLWLGSRMMLSGDGGSSTTGGADDLAILPDDPLVIAVVPTSRAAPMPLVNAERAVWPPTPFAIQPMPGSARRDAVSRVPPPRAASALLAPPNAVDRSAGYARLQSLVLAHRMTSRPSSLPQGFAFHSDGGRVALTGGLLPALRPRTSALTSRWSGAAWIALRDGSSGPDVATVASAAMLGGSQAGGRIAYALGPAGRHEAYARLVTAGRRMDSAEAAVGAAWRPLAAVPVQLAVERRQRVAGSEGRSAMAVMAIGGVSDQSLPHGWRLDGYAAGGVVGFNRRDGFAEGAVRVSRPLVTTGRLTLSGGAGIWAAAQPGVERVDAGPILSARLERAAPRLSLDWRQRIAGQAVPASGIAVTLATDF